MKQLSCLLVFFIFFSCNHIESIENDQGNEDRNLELNKESAVDDNRNKFVDSLYFDLN